MNNWNDIKNKIKDILQFDFERIFDKKGKDNAVFHYKNKLEIVLNSLKLILDLNDEDLENLFFENNFKQSIFQYISNIFTYFEQIKSGELGEDKINRIFSDFAYVNEKVISKIKFHNFERNKDNILNLNRKKSEEEIFHIQNKLKQIEFEADQQKKNREIAKSLEKTLGKIKIEEEKLKKGKDIAESLISAKEEINKIKIEEYRYEFFKKANKHLIFNKEKYEDEEVKKLSLKNRFTPSLFWILTSIVFAGLAYANITDTSVYIKQFLTVKDKVYFEFLKDIPYIIYFSIFSKIFIPAFISIFSLNRYLTNLRLYEIYINKDINLKNMLFLLENNLVSKNGNQELIMEKAIDNLFSEVSLKENKNNKDLIKILLKDKFHEN